MKVLGGFDQLYYIFPYNMAKDLSVKPYMINPENLTQFIEYDNGPLALSERERTVILDYYRNGEILDEIAHKFGISRERIRQIKAKAIRKLRHPKRANNWLMVDRKEYKKLKDRNYILEKWIIEHPESENVGSVEEIIEPSELIDELELSVRSYNALKRRGIRTISDLCGLTIDQLIDIRNLGKRSLEEITSKVSERGLCFKESEAVL